MHHGGMKQKSPHHFHHHDDEESGYDTHEEGKYPPQHKLQNHPWMSGEDEGSHGYGAWKKWGQPQPLAMREEHEMVGSLSSVSSLNRIFICI